MAYYDIFVDLRTCSTGDCNGLEIQGTCNWSTAIGLVAYEVLCCGVI